MSSKWYSLLGRQCALSQPRWDDAKLIVRGYRPPGLSTHQNLLATRRFYRATLWVSAIFAVSRCCPSVRTSIILVSWGHPVVPNSKVNALIGDVKCTGVGKICNIRIKSPFISETVREIHGCYGTLIGSHRWWIDSCRFRWPWVTLTGRTRGFKLFRRSP